MAPARAASGHRLAPSAARGIASRMKASRFLCVAPLVAVLSCGDDEFGEGIRRPDTVIAPRPVLEPLVIAEIVVAGESPFVEIRNGGAGDVSLVGFSVTTNRGSTPITADELAPGGRLVVAVEAALLSRTSGEAALTDENAVVHAYVSWGTDPGLSSSQLFADAFADGAPLTAPLVVPFPIEATDALVFEGTPGCGTATPGDDPAGVTPCAPGTGSLLLTEFLPVLDPPAPAEGEVQTNVPTVPWVELLNASPAEIELDGVRLCNGDVCVSVLGSTGTLPVGERAIVLLDRTVAEAQTLTGVTIGLGDGIGLDCGVARVCANAPLGKLESVAELSVARPGGAGGQGAALLSYARFALAASVDLETLAVDSGLWTVGAVEAPVVYGQSYQRLEGEADGPMSWTGAAPTPTLALP